jgi:hypothetical protein
LKTPNEWSTSNRYNIPIKMKLTGLVTYSGKYG